MKLCVRKLHAQSIGPRANSGKSFSMNIVWLNLLLRLGAHSINSLGYLPDYRYTYRRTCRSGASRAPLNQN